MRRSGGCTANACLNGVISTSDTVEYSITVFTYSSRALLLPANCAIVGNYAE